MHRLSALSSLVMLTVLAAWGLPPTAAADENAPRVAVICGDDTTIHYFYGDILLEIAPPCVPPARQIVLTDGRAIAEQKELRERVGQRFLAVVGDRMAQVRPVANAPIPTPEAYRASERAALEESCGKPFPPELAHERQTFETIKQVEVAALRVTDEESKAALLAARAALTVQMGFIKTEAEHQWRRLCRLLQLITR